MRHLSPSGDRNNKQITEKKMEKWECEIIKKLRTNVLSFQI